MQFSTSFIAAAAVAMFGNVVAAGCVPLETSGGPITGTIIKLDFAKLGGPTGQGGHFASGVKFVGITDATIAKPKDILFNIWNHSGKPKTFIVATGVSGQNAKTINKFTLSAAAASEAGPANNQACVLTAAHFEAGVTDWAVSLIE